MNVGKIVICKQIVEGLYVMTIETGACNFTRPGQYAEIKLIGTDLERAYPISEYDSKRFTFYFRTENKCSEELVKLPLEAEVEVETGLGDGFDVDSIPDGVVLAADTYGIAQMLGLMRSLLIQGKSCSLVLGYTTKSSVFMTETFSNLCSNIEIFTADGSNGREGGAADGVRNVDYVCAAGSIGMLDKLTEKAKHGQYNDGMNITVW